MIDLVVAACAGDKNARKQVEERFDSFRKGNWQIVEAIQAIWNGERDEEKLAEPVNYQSGTIIRAIVARMRGENPYPETAELSAQAAPAASAGGAQGGITLTPQQARIALAAALPIHQPEARPQVEPLLTQLDSGGFTDLAAVIRRIWDGERDETALTQGLDDEDATAVRVTLAAAADPALLKQLMEMTGGE